MLADSHNFKPSLAGEPSVTKIFHTERTQEVIQSKETSQKTSAKMTTFARVLPRFDRPLGSHCASPSLPIGMHINDS